MEFPELGENCAFEECKILDYLPVKCDCCSKIFCKNHFAYSRHKCPLAQKRDRQVPVCPLCNRPVAIGLNQTPDQVVNEHLDNECESGQAKARRKSLKSNKLFTNSCNFSKCKTKEIIPVICNVCKLNFCIRHRHEDDHRCTGPVAKPKFSFLGQQRAKFDRNSLHELQGTLTEDAALNMAIAESLKTKAVTAADKLKAKNDLKEVMDERRNAYLKSKSKSNSDTKSGDTSCSIN